MGKLEEAAEQEGSVEARGNPESQPQAEKAWQVAYSNLGMLSVVGATQLAVVQLFENLQKDYADKPHEFAPISVLTNGGKAETVWLNPALVEGIFGEAISPAAMPEGPEGMPDFMVELLQRAEHAQGVDEGSVVEVNPAQDDEENGGVNDGQA